MQTRELDLLRSHVINWKWTHVINLRMSATTTGKYGNSLTNTGQGERHPWAYQWQVEEKEEASLYHPLNGPRTTDRSQTTMMCCQQV